jgi:hypothetical protein
VIDKQDKIVDKIAQETLRLIEIARTSSNKEIKPEQFKNQPE